MTERGFKLSLNQAAKEAGKSKSVIHDKIKSGILSASKGDKGSYQIDPAELFRVFPKNEENAVPNIEKEQNRTPEKNGENSLKIRELELELKFANKEKTDLATKVQEKEQEIANWKQETADWKEQAQKLLLTHQPSESPLVPEPPKKRTPVSGVIWALLGACVFAVALMGFIYSEPKLLDLLGRVW